MSIRTWIVLYAHKHGFDFWPVFQPNEPSVKSILRQLRKNGEWTNEEDNREDTYVEIRGPWPLPNVKEGVDAD